MERTATDHKFQTFCRVARDRKLYIAVALRVGMSRKQMRNLLLREVPSAVRDGSSIDANHDDCLSRVAQWAKTIFERRFLERWSGAKFLPIECYDVSHRVEPTRFAFKLRVFVVRKTWPFVDRMMQTPVWTDFVTGLLDEIRQTMLSPTLVERAQEKLQNPFYAALAGFFVGHKGNDDALLKWIVDAKAQRRKWRNIKKDYPVEQ